MRSSQGIALAVLLAAVAGGCASRRPISVEELRPHMSRFFPGITPEQVISATEELFLLDDPDDVSFTPTEDGIDVRRNYWQSLLISGTKGHYVWKVTTKEQRGGASVYVAIKRLDTVVSFLIIESVRENTISQSWEFDAYFHRLGFLLGVQTDWTSCDDIQVTRRANYSMPMYPSALCWLADDNPPPRLKSLADFEHRSSAALDSSPSAKHGSK